ncbi:MAG: polysaccharide biosynthesis protein [Phycisphaerales bacterium]|nr:polysaccharide biosynthesis protein [Phycisphaerales bacterium]
MFKRRNTTSPTEPIVDGPHPNPLPAMPGEGTKRRFNPAYLIETGWLAGGFISKLLIQIGTLYYLTAGLGRDGVGTFFALLGMLACVVPFVQLGNYDLTIRQIARGEDPAVVSGRAMRSTIAAFLAFLPVLLILRLLLAKDVGWAAYLMVATGDLLGMRVVANVQAVATGFRWHYVVAVGDFLIGLTRFVAVFVAAHFHASVDAMLMLYAFTSLPAAFASYAWMVWRVGRPQWRGGELFADFADHRRMVIAWFAEMAAGQGDKPLLKALSDAGQTGIYGTASKFFAVVIVPIDLLTQVFRPRIGHAYAQSAEAGRRLGTKMTLTLLGLGLMAGGGLFTVAWLLPWVAPKLMKSDFADVRLALMWLSIVPPVYGLQRANVILSIARGATGVYASATMIGAAVGLSTLAILAPRFGWHAACGAYFVYICTSCVATWRLGRETPAIEPASAALQPA